MLSNITSAEAALAEPTLAEPTLAEPTLQLLAGSCAGAFACDGAWAGSRTKEVAAALPVPRIRRAAAAISQGHAQGGVYAGGGYPTDLAQISTAQISTVQISTAQVSTKQFKQMTRINPVVPGGVGPHPAREPEPV
jgi:hypothetical protein